jgi:hypothetical protein
MPFKILKRGKEYILKSPTREYKHKSLAKAKAQKKLLEEKDLKQKQKQSQKQVVTVIVNAPTKRRVTAPKPQIQEQSSTRTGNTYDSKYYTFRYSRANATGKTITNRIIGRR